MRVSSLAVLLASTAAMWACGASAEAASAIAAADASNAGAEIVVTGQREDYGVRATSTATRTATDVKDVPQAMTVVTAAQIQDQSLRSMADLVLFVPGASANSGEGNRDQIVLRGNSSTADFFIDGVRDDVQYLRDFYNIDRVEVLRGPNAMIFGRGGGGGIINRVRKVAGPSAFVDGITSIDSHGGYRLTGDVNQPIDAATALRVNGLYEDGASFRRHYDLKRYGVNPTIVFRPDDATRIDLSYEYFHDRRTADRGVPSLNDRPLTGYDEIFFGDPDLSVARVDAHSATATIERRFSTALTLRNRLSYGEYDKFYQNVFASTSVTSDNKVALAGYNASNDRKNLFNQTDLVWEGRIGGVEQTLLVGTEFGRQTSRNRRATANFAGPNGSRVASLAVLLDDPTVASGARFAPSATDANNRTKADVAAVYIQDQIRFAPFLELVAGVRFDRFKLRVDDFRVANLDLDRTDHLVSPRLGLILKPIDNLSLYASFSRSYLPQSGDQFSSLDLNTAALKPERFDNLEVGAKWEPFAGLLATAAIYRLDRTNTRATDPANPTRVVLTGAQRSTGLELGLERSISKRWKVSAGYARQRARITETTAVAVAGKSVPLVPRNSFSLWSRFDPTRQLGLGLGVIARSKSYTTISNSVFLPGYMRVDGALFYRIAPAIQAQVNVENLFGANYYATANSDNNILPGAPRTLRATLRFGL